MKAPDNYCCGSGVCIINDSGECWCGQAWDGEKMAPVALKPKIPAEAASESPDICPKQPKPEA